VKSAIIKRSVVIAGRKTSVSLEQPFWDVIREIAGAERTTASAVLRRVDGARSRTNLSSAVRVFVLDYVRGRMRHAGRPADPAPSADRRGAA
jgi:predicted DNA-binding ribbon-helix-helix protein